MAIDKVEELREKLRNARTNNTTSAESEQSGDQSTPNTSGTSASPIGHSTNESTKDGSSIQHISRPSERTGTIGRGIDGIERSIRVGTGSVAPLNLGKRQSNRRSSQNNSPSWADGTELPSSSSPTTTTSGTKVGNLYADESIPERNFNKEVTSPRPEIKDESKVGKVERIEEPRKRGRPRKSGVDGIIQADSEGSKSTKEVNKQESSTVFPWFKEKSVLSEAEVKALEEPLITAIRDNLIYLDQYLWMKSEGPEGLQQPIWSDMSDVEITCIVHVLLRQGTKSPAAAQTARAIANGNDYLTTAIVLIPRMMKTINIVKPKRGKKRAN